MFSITTKDASQSIKLWISLFGVFCLMAGPVQAQDTQSVSGSSQGQGYIFHTEYDPLAPNLVTGRRIDEGADNVLGPYTCNHTFSLNFQGSAEPPAADVEGVCDPASAFVFSYSLNSTAECRLEHTGQIFSPTTDTFVSCIPFTCYGADGLLQAGCTQTNFYTATSMEKDGAFEATSESVEKVTVDEVTFDADRGLVVYRGSITSTGMTDVTFNIPEEDRPARNVVLEVPSGSSTMSGIGIISGWSCLGGDLRAEISDANGVIATFPLPHGTARADTEPVCGHSNTGFSATMNWAHAGAGEKTIRLIQNGEEVASHTFPVVTFDEEFIRGANGMCTVNGFPSAGESVTVEWDQPQQSFVVTEIN